MPEIKPTRVFSKEQPCTKVDLWNAFITSKGLRPLSVVVSRGEIGLNAPKYLVKQEFLERYEDKGVEYYAWTAEGAEWLRKGLLRHLELHPELIPAVQYYLQLVGGGKKRRVVRKAA